MEELEKITGKKLRTTSEKIVSAYRQNYGLGDNIGMREIVKHADLESRLTMQLKKSSKSERAYIFVQAYSELYEKLPWLIGTGGIRDHSEWLKVLKPRSRIIEIGSGNGSLITYLSQNEYSCVGTDLSDKRGVALNGSAKGIDWQSTDGINLQKFHQQAGFDHVISDQVVEHIHPDDMLQHLSSARSLLKNGGSYVLRTPHRSAGPHDLSRVFDLDEPCFMHLKEYNFREIAELARAAGYRDAHVIIGLPTLWSNGRIVLENTTLSSFNFLVDLFEERIVATPSLRRKLRRLGRIFLIPSSVWLRLLV